ncbi:cobalt-precorrin-5B (C(1))-methyltransferase CbiD [Desulfovibrio sp. OttesenSCG-928-C06]|nr:cobalt-precorrin-5B (C(1))-methyltransferase CbiD [Desulfovibrio sp. OttesenSCG-928-C06]
MQNSTKSHNKLREGFSTGSAVSAGAAAAVRLLLTGTAQCEVSIAPPPFTGSGASLSPDNPVRLGIPVAYAQILKDSVKVAIIKDGGDDPDATNRMLIEVYAARHEDAFTHLPGTWLELEAGLRIKCGPGVGTVTLPGLPARPGEPAINPHPRKQIFFAVYEELSRLGLAPACLPEFPVCLYLRIPRGAERAKNTLNSRLGILGGVSILGTRGTVRPFSHEAWQATISQGLDIAHSLGIADICFSTGRRSELGLQKLYPDLPEQAFIQAADFAKYSVTSAAQRKFGKIIWGCYCGKLLKLAQGLPYTHARSARADLPLLAEWAGNCGAPADICGQIAALPTAQGAFDLLEAHSPAISAELLKKVAKTAMATLTAWLAGTKTSLCLHVLRPDNTPWLQLEDKTGSNEIF